MREGRLMACTLARGGYDTLTAMTRWLIDGNNVMGSRPDGWWRDRPGAMQRLVNQLDDLAASTGEEVHVVFDGRDVGLQAVAAFVSFAGHADDVIAARARPGWRSEE